MSTATLPPPAGPTREPFPRPWTDADLRTARRLGVFADRELSAVGGRLVDAAGDPVRLTRHEYQRLWGAVFRPEQRVQLIRGVVVMESPMNPPHASAISLLMIELAAAFGAGCYVRPQLPIDLDSYTEPHPDVAVVTGSPRDYTTDHPRAALLIVEVSESTLFDDTTDKAELYATAGVADYWVLDLDNRKLLVFRDPAPLPAGLGATAYRTRLTLGPADGVAPLAAPNSTIRIADLLP